MRSGWKHFGAFGGFVAMVVVAVVMATRNEAPSVPLLLGQLGVISFASYRLTFLVWPRRARGSKSHPSRSARAAPVPPESAGDRRPVLVIGHRPAGSKPGSRIHARESPTVRGARGRWPGPRMPREEIRWPAQR